MDNVCARKVIMMMLKMVIVKNVQHFGHLKINKSH